MAVGASRNITGHHRRRSSVLTAGSSQLHPVLTDTHTDREGRLSPKEDGPNGEEQQSLIHDHTDSSDLSSIAESDEDDSDDGIHDDEETGLTAKQRNERRRRRKRQRRRLDAKIAGVKGKTSNVVADKNVATALAVNAGLIGLWYLFSLSISIVSLQWAGILLCFPTNPFDSIISGCFQKMMSSFLFRCSRPVYICSFNSCSPPSYSTSCLRFVPNNSLAPLNQL